MKYNTVDNDVYPLIVVYGVTGKDFSVNLVVYYLLKEESTEESTRFLWISLKSKAFP